MHGVDKFIVTELAVCGEMLGTLSTSEVCVECDCTVHTQIMHMDLYIGLIHYSKYKATKVAEMAVCQHVSQLKWRYISMSLS
jgi:hypothetical protein